MYSLVFNETGPKSYTVDSILLLMVSYHLLPQCLMVKSSLKVLIPGIIGHQVLTVTSTNSTRRDLRDQSGAEMCYSTGSSWDRYSTTKWSVYPKFHGNLIFPVNCGIHLKTKPFGYCSKIVHHPKSMVQTCSISSFSSDSKNRPATCLSIVTPLRLCPFLPVVLSPPNGITGAQWC